MFPFSRSVCVLTEVESGIFRYDELHLIKLWNAKDFLHERNRYNIRKTALSHYSGKSEMHVNEFNLSSEPLLARWAQTIL